MLFQIGLKPKENDMKSFEIFLSDCCDSILTNVDEEEPRLLSFIKDMDGLIEESQYALDFCSMAWKAAVRMHMSFTSDTSIVSSRVFLDYDALTDLAFVAAAEGDTASLDIFLGDPRSDASKTARDNGETLLHVLMKNDCCRAQPADLILAMQRLLEAGCNFSAINQVGQTPLHIWNWDHVFDEADEKDIEELVQTFIKIGVDVKIQDQEGETILHANVKSFERTEILLRSVIPQEISKTLRMPDSEGYTPLMRAIHYDDEDVAEMLLNHTGHEPEALQNPALIVPLAGRMESTTLLQNLISSGLQLVSSNGDSHLHHLTYKSSSPYVRLLKELLPGYCNVRVANRLPIENYLRECLVQNAESPQLDVLRDIGIPDTINDSDSTGQFI
jgi:hypothetical protein